MAVDITNHLIPWAIAKRMQADAWDEGAEAAATELDGPEYWLPPADKFPNPYREDA